MGPFQFAKQLTVGMRATLTCAVLDGDPPFDFSWYKDGVSLQETNQISLKSHEFMSTLVISNLGPYSNGNYTCRVSNQGGKDEQFSVLNIKGEKLDIELTNKYFIFTFFSRNYM